MNTDTIQAPVLLQPANNSVVDQLNPYFTWQNTNVCVVWGYTLKVSSDIQFSDARLWNGTAFTSSHPAFPLTDCTRYFWRVVPFQNLPPNTDTLVNSFYVDTTGSCPTEVPGSIDGLVWENLNPGQGYQPGGPVFPGISVHLGLGHCPGQPLLSMLTDASGGFSFPQTKPGSYCVWVDASEPDNAVILGSGSWVTDQGSWGSSQEYREISLPAGQTISDPGFAWFPSSIHFIPIMNPYCRSGPDPSFSQIGLAMKDQPYIIDGRNADNNWFLLRLTRQLECWVPSGAGNVSGDISGIPVILVQPTPGATKTPSGNPVDCTGFNEQSCNAHSASCQWVPKLIAPNTGDCINK
jgi:hypothetical protein